MSKCNMQNSRSSAPKRPRGCSGRASDASRCRCSGAMTTLRSGLGEAVQAAVQPALKTLAVASRTCSTL